MRFSRIYRRKKRLLPLLRLRAKPKAQPTMSWCSPVENAYKREIHFLRACQLLHTCFCGCDDFINHVIRLQNLHGNLHQPTGPSTPPVTRRALALPAAPESWRSGGGGGDAARSDDGPGADGGDYAPGDLDELYDAVAADQE